MAVFTKEGRAYHIQVAPGEIGRYVFLPGDPFRTDLIASFLDDAKLAWAAPLRPLPWKS